MRQPGRTVMASIALVLVTLVSLGGCVAERVNTERMTQAEKAVTTRPSIGSIRIPQFRHPGVVEVYEQQTGRQVGLFTYNREPRITVPAGTYKLKFRNYFLENITVQAGQEVVLER